MPPPPGSPPPDILETLRGERLAYRRVAGRPEKTGVVWLGGFRSDMEGGKALALDAWARATDRPFLRFDYSGHGASSGTFADGCIGAWSDDALAVFDTLTDGPQLLVGSSMGGWIALLVALARPERVAGLVLIAPAPDFTERLLWPSLPEDARQRVLKEGVTYLHSEYDPAPTPITRKLIEDGRRHLLLDRESLPITAPVRIIQGLEDPDVPWTHSLELVSRLESPDIEFYRVAGGDHRLSTEADLDRLVRVTEALAAHVDPSPSSGADSAASTAASPSR